MLRAFCVLMRRAGVEGKTILRVQSVEQVLRGGPLIAR